MTYCAIIESNMTDLAVDDLSDEEAELLIDFVEWAGNFDRQVLDRQTIDGDSEEIGLMQAFEFLLPYVSEEASEFDAQMLRLFRLDSEINSGPVFEYEHEDKLPDDAYIRPDELNRFLRKDELEEFFTLAGQMIEVLSVELIMEEVVADSRDSSSTRDRIARKSQREREWLLWVTGIISDGEKGEIRRTYDLRSSVVHDSGSAGGFLQQVEIPGDTNRAKKSIDALHEKIHGIKLHHRFGDMVA